jgi:hypothetical protein
LDGSAVWEDDDGRELVARDFGERQKATGDTDAEVEVISALACLGRNGGDIHRDLNGRMILADPFDGRFEV